MHIKDEAICIRAIDYSETSQVVTFFGRKSGKVNAIAKGAKRERSSFDGSIEILSSGFIVYANSQKEGLATLTEFEQNTQFEGLRKSLVAFYAGLFAMELVGLFVDEYDPHPGLYERLKGFLESISGVSDKTHVLTYLILLELVLLKEVGLQPVTNACSNCRKTYDDKWQKVYFSSSANGLLCRDCEMSFTDKIRISGRAARCLNNFRNLSSASQQTIRELEDVVIRHLCKLAGKAPKMAKYFTENTF